MTNESSEPDVLSMFFDPDFVPHAYLDALVSSTLSTPSTNQITPTQLTSIDNLKDLQSKCTSLLARLDYYSNQLSGDIKEKIETLKSSSSVISYSYDPVNNKIEDPQSLLTGTTRLDYYIDTLRNSIHSLNTEVKSVDTEITKLNDRHAKFAEGEDQEAIAQLLQLKQAKDNLLSVIQVFETASDLCQTEPDNVNGSSRDAPIGARVNQHSYTTITPNSFTNSITVIQDELLDRLKNDQESTVDQALIDRIDQLIEILPLFRNLDNFYTPYKRFVTKLMAEKDVYLSTRQNDDD